MKKVLMLLMVMSLVLGVSGVMAADVPQTGNGNVAPNVGTVTFTPSTLAFPDIIPGGHSSLADMITIPGTSPTEITQITVAPTNLGGIFNNANVLFSTDNVQFNSTTDFVGTPIDVAAGGSYSFFVQMNVPTGSLAGAYSGTITYTIMPQVAA